ncbi:AAA family ATPase [Methanobacterium alcaliphilum]|uniref:AAA family ATPase n=1 Tax=Methanobacterium alcaliphilum TaxID=392018 RepID=UPI00200B1F65|nr:AAA family ATPase [Methanobacterium alcaliphilum]MCK9151817.1 AAA family ATPase [Methanobacterium alcaliphilum]
MKLLELEIQNFRGVKQLKIETQGRNFLIWGPNGSGKSTIVDSLDFLLTGNVSRMTGKGTKDIKIKKHAPHIDSEVEDVEIKALVKLQNLDEPVKIKRSLKNPKKLIYDPSYEKNIEPVLELATRGQHVLTRREILNYITADSSTRARQIEKLLKLDDVEKTRIALNKTKNQLKNDYKMANGALNSSIESIKNIMDESYFEEETILDFVNENREILEGSPLNNLDSTSIKEGINHPRTPEDFVNLGLLEKNIHNLQNKLSKDNQNYLSQLNQSYVELNNKISSNPQLNDTVNRLRLTELGLDLLDDSGTCPLCESSWEMEELKENLTTRIKLLGDIQKDLQKMDDLKEELIQIFTSTCSILSEIIPVAGTLKLEKPCHELKSWQNDIKRLLDEDIAVYSPENIRTLLAPENVSYLLDEIVSTARKSSNEPSPKQTAWDILTKLEENLKNYTATKINCLSAFKSYKKAEVLLHAFIKSRELILGGLFSEIEERFIELYKQLHGSDEFAFNAQLKPKGSGVDFYVDFYGRGSHPPHALHSEGHQDTMGICLYLALAERLTEGYINLIILDDVMMSVDAPHRREICRLLASFFKGRQFFITTHDQTWARQLQLEGVVNSKQMIELYNWSIENGPNINSRQDMWEKIGKDLIKSDVNSAAFKLRRGSEEFFRAACNSLGASVTFKENQRWELGDFLPAALTSYKSLLKSAKVAANSWNNQDEVMRLKNIDDNSKEVFDRSNAEQWAVNINVHYNNWANFSVEDFRPVVDAFHDLFGVFQCNDCGGVLHLTKNGLNAEAVRCNCGGVNWNLVKK